MGDSNCDNIFSLRDFSIGTIDTIGYELLAIFATANINA